MEANRDRPKRLGDKPRTQIINKISSLFIENLDERLDRLDGNIQAKDLSKHTLFTTLPECRKIVEEVAGMSWVKKTFCRCYVKEAVATTVADIIKASDTNNIKEYVPECVSQMVTALDSYNKSFYVYVPLEGLKLAEELQELQFGDAKMLQMNEDRLSQLLQPAVKQLSRIENNIDTQQAELEELVIVARDVQEMYQLWLKKKALKEELRDFAMSVRQRSLTEAERQREQSLAETDKKINAEFEYVSSKVAEALTKLREGREPRSNRSSSEKGDDREKLSALLDGPDTEKKFEEYYKKQLNRLDQRKKQLDDRRDKVYRYRTHVRRLERTLKDKLCLRYSYVAVPHKSFEYARQDAGSLIELLRYALAVLVSKGKGPRIGLQGEIARQDRTIVAISCDNNVDITIRGGRSGASKVFEITSEHISILHDYGLLDMARSLSGSDGDSLTNIEALLKRCISWFSLSQMQTDKQSEFLSLVIILEGLLTPDDKNAPISATIADGAAILLANTEDDRKEIRKLVRDVYETRSDVVHGRWGLFERPR